MKIYIGTKNPAKIESVNRVFSEHDVVEGIEVESKVSAQPYSDEETLEGAINRARECVNFKKTALGIGLEGGVMELGGEIFLCNWGALVDQHENVYTASGARIPLPESIQSGLEKGRELGDLIDEFVGKQEVSKNEGAVGVFTVGLVSRTDMFEHVVKLLKGQWDYDQNR
ncbi:DUF84 family protein [Thalassobacillus sp. CUG 92003]|uniref:DUF84 family protein n=1 Tax=Thalassobacillus sp. CUG 92003 TaxID=2736641 RepID=UPI0015E67CF3|nr:DUF84 family protein [Thalassobacillus sp. CUG 92003]